MRNSIAVCFTILLLLAGGCGKEEQSKVKIKKPPIIKNKLDWLKSYAAAIDKSKESGKPVFAFFTGSDWCKYCSLLDNQVLSNPVFANWAKENVVLLELDYPRNEPQDAELKKQNEELLGRYRVSGFPTVLFLTADGVPFLKAGYEAMDANEWVGTVDSRLKKALEKLASTSAGK